MVSNVRHRLDYSFAVGRPLVGLLLVGFFPLYLNPGSLCPAFTGGVGHFDLPPDGHLHCGLLSLLAHCFMS
jgi:hypothetical protein